jgi:hypothetical protein
MSKPKKITPAPVAWGPEVGLQPLFEGGPKGPTALGHKTFHHLSWAFHKMRYERLGDKFYNPWMPKHLLSCKRIIMMALDDIGEIKRRIGHLLLWMAIDPDWYDLTPECLLNRWDGLAKPPADAVGGRPALRKQAHDAGRRAAKAAISEKYDG